MKWTKDGFVLPSGRELYAYDNIVGIDPDGDVYEGYDGGLGSMSQPAPTGWTPEERAELAREMMRLWARFGGIHFFQAARRHEGP